MEKQTVMEAQSLHSLRWNLSTTMIEMHQIALRTLSETVLYNSAIQYRYVLVSNCIEMHYNTNNLSMLSEKKIYLKQLILTHIEIQIILEKCKTMHQNPPYMLRSSPRRRPLFWRGRHNKLYSLGCTPTVLPFLQ